MQVIENRYANGTVYPFDHQFRMNGCQLTAMHPTKFVWPADPLDQFLVYSYDESSNLTAKKS